MSILQTIYDNDLIGKPLFIEDFVSEKLSYDSVKTLLARYVKEGIVKRYSQGVYYISEKDILFGEIPLNSMDIFERRFIFNKTDIYGYYTGLKLLNMIGLSTQVPNIIEICSNKENSIKRTIQIGKRKIITRKPYIDINKENVLYLQFFDIFRYADEEMIKENKNKILDFYKLNKLNDEIFVSLEKKIPIKIRKKIRGSGIYDELTRRQRTI